MSGGPLAPRALRIVILGLSITSAWGNGHATTYRGLVRELVRRGHDVLFLERDVPWYAAHRDLPSPPEGRTQLYADLDALYREHAVALRCADLVIVGSYVPDGVAVCDWVQRHAGGPTAFYDIDTPVTLAALRKGEEPYLARRQIPGFDLYLSFTGGPTLQRLEEEFGARAARVLYCSVDPARYRPLAVPRDVDLGYMGTYSTDRQPVVERLLLDAARQWGAGRFAIAGAQYPDTQAWPANVAYDAHVPPARHAAFYASQRFTLNVTRADMVAAGWSPSVRLFEAAACGTAIISDRWQGIEDVLTPGSEVYLVDTTDDVLELLRELPDAQRTATAERARERVLASHTAASRARQLEDYVSELAA